MSEVIDDRGIRVDYIVDGTGPPVLVLHGAYSTRDELIPVLGPLLRDRGLRGVHPDLPGMGASTPTNAQSADDVLDVLDALVAEEIGPEPFAVIGHSFGAYLARGVAARHPAQVRGLALISPYVDDFEPAPERVVEDDGGLGEIDDDVRGDYLGYFVVRTAATRERFERLVRPSLGRYDGAAVDRIMTASVLTPDPDVAPYGGPVAVLLGRDDGFIGWRAQRALVDLHPRATLVVADGAGHALVHERPVLVRAVLEDWLDRAAVTEVDDGRGRSATLGT